MSTNIIMDVCTVRNAVENIHRLNKEGGKGAKTASLLAMGEATRVGKTDYARFVVPQFQQQILVEQLHASSPLTVDEVDRAIKGIVLAQAASNPVEVKKHVQKEIAIDLVAAFNDSEYFFLFEEILDVFGRTRIDHEDLTLVAAAVAAHRANGEPVVIVTDDKGLVAAHQVLGEHLPYLAIVSPEQYLAGAHLRVLEAA